MCGVDKQLERFRAQMGGPLPKVALRITHLLQQCVAGWQVLLKVRTRSTQIDLAPPFVAIFPGLQGLVGGRAAVTHFNRFAHVQALEHVRHQQKIAGNVTAADLRFLKNALLQVSFELAQILVSERGIVAHRCWQFLRFAFSAT